MKVPSLAAMTHFVLADTYTTWCWSSREQSTHTTEQSW